jgi:hypothetical protein
MVVMGIIIILTSIVSMDITDIPTTITIMKEANTTNIIGEVTNRVNIMKVESVVTTMRGERLSKLLLYN